MKNKTKYSIWQKIKIILILIVSILFLIFIAQNWDKVEITFLAWRIQISLFIVLFVSFFIGMLITILYFRHIKALKKVIHKRNDEINDLKKKETNVNSDS